VLGGRRVTPPSAPAPPEPPPAPLRAASATARAAAESTLDSAFSGSAEAEGSSPQVGQPSRPANDSISLDSVFGDESGRGSEPQATAARPASGSGGFSFDDFFGGTAPGGAPAAGPPGPPGPAGAAATPGATAEAKGGAPRASSGRSRPAGEDEGELDQFQSWLKGLKG
jgi:hypothetical protein